MMEPSSKEKYLLTRELMEYAKNSNGKLFGGSISSYFSKQHFTNAYKHTLIKNNDLEHFDKYYQDINYDPETWLGRNKTIRDIDVFFKSDCDVEKYTRNIYTIPGVYDIQVYNPCSQPVDDYRRHILFARYFAVKKILVKYLFDHSFCRKGTSINVPIDIVTIRPDSDWNSPVSLMQELTIKQLMWDTTGITCNIQTKNHLSRSLEILDDFNSNVCFIAHENRIMRNEMRELIPSKCYYDEAEYDDDYDHSNDYSRDVVSILTRIIESRIMVISRLLSYHGFYTIVNSPLSLEKKGDCGICFEEECEDVLKWNTKQNNGKSYCKKCILNYIRSFMKVSGSHTHDECEPDSFHKDPILTNKEWKYLTNKQIYLIENVLVCPVGNKADFSCVNTH